MSAPQSSFAQTPEPPYYAVIFTSQRSEGDRGYGQMAERMVQLAAKQPGFLGIETVRGADGFGITVSYWMSEEAIAAWKAHLEHKPAQEAGQRAWYTDYQLRVAKVERAYDRVRSLRNQPSAFEIKVDDLRGPEIAELLREHLRCMAEVSPPESMHALDLEELRKPGITFWSIWQGMELAGCGALKELDPGHGEIKSMRTARTHLRKGVASLLLEKLIAEAKRRGYRRLSLETGSMPYFQPAHNLYRKFGFIHCPPFIGYSEDPNSVFMTREL
jgi:putative acetyltransferase